MAPCYDAPPEASSTRHPPPAAQNRSGDISHWELRIRLGRLHVPAEVEALVEIIAEVDGVHVDRRAIAPAVLEMESPLLELAPAHVTEHRALARVAARPRDLMVRSLEVQGAAEPLVREPAVAPELVYTLRRKHERSLI